MYLKNIEVQGFKSFANKINFEFHNGITCIVGPNGSGKSNVADAVRWVLGEQSAKQLRGSSMQDVIFSGTEIRKPLGYAYVAITLDNSDHKLNIDYDEVTVSRKVFRSGESEYKMNGVVCRLRDIHELFYDTGIGKEGYSIIGQGQIEKILSNKPEERRELFDEAVGIVKFKRRKKETLKKLEDEHTNLVRVRDILQELEKQVGPLQRQSETAKKYLKLRDELKRYDLQLFSIDSKASRQHLLEVTEKKEVVQGDLSDTRASLEQLTESYETVDRQMHELEAGLAELNSQLTELTEQKNACDSRILVCNEQKNTEKNNASNLEERLEQFRRDMERLEEEKQGLFRQECQLEQQVAHKASEEEALTRLMKQLDDEIADAMSIVENDKNAMMKLLNEKSDVSAKLQHFETLREQVLRRRGEVSSRILRIKSEQEMAQKSLQELEVQYQKICDTIGGLRKQFQALKQRQQQLTDELNQVSKERDEKLEQYHMLHSRATSLKNLDEHFEGYQNSIRRIMEYKTALGSKGTAIEGVVSDLIQVDKKYEVAIETALGGAIQNIVTANTDMAKQCISYLKQNKYGRATFLPRDAVKGSGAFSRPEVLKEKGVIGTAVSLVSFDEKFSGVFEQLLGRVVVVDHIDQATALAKKYQQSLRIVTLEGDLIAPGGSMTGGAYKNNNHLLGRKREVAELEKKTATAQAELKKLEQKLSKIEEKLSACNAEGQEITTKLQQAALSETSLSLSKKQCEERLETARVSLGDAASENAQIEKELEGIQTEQQKVADMIRAIEQENVLGEETMAQYAKELEEKRQLREEKANELSEMRLHLAEEKQKLVFCQENVSRIESEGLRMTSEAEELLGRQAESIELMQQRDTEIQVLEERSVAYSVQIAENKEQQTALTAQKTALMAEQKDFFIKQQEITSRISDLEVESIRLSNQEEKLEEHLAAQTNYLFVEYELTPAQVGEPDESLTVNVAELKREITQYKASMKALGHVNVGAIEEYAEVSQRYEFMKTQYEDLTKAEEVLQGIINELDEGMRAQFHEQFARIQIEFERVFQELFGGGHAKLELVEGEDVIEAGIRIISQPPGKKLQNMMQLSGGEKALTAISLLFAIQSLKPSPFCLLDEIEAALDDSNVSRFAGYLHKLTKDTQFILISHRRGTMVMADRLYGITMQEKGVSTLVSVSMIEAELDQ